MVTADAGMRGGKVIALQAAGRRGAPPRAAPAAARAPRQPRPRRVAAGCTRAATSTTRRCAKSTPARSVPCAWLESSRAVVHPLHVRHHRHSRKACSATPAATRWRSPSSMRHIFCGSPARRCSRTSDIGWVVGHSYIVYGPLIAGMATIMYEGLPIRPDAGIWWKIVEEHKVTTMFSSPTAIRVLKKQDPAFMTQSRPVVACATCSSPASRSTSRPRAGSPTRWACAIDRQLLADRNRLADPVRAARRRGDAAQVRPPVVPGVRLRRAARCDEATGEDVARRREGRAGDRAAAAAGLHDDRLGRRRALRADLLRRRSRTS